MLVEFKKYNGSSIMINTNFIATVEPMDGDNSSQITYTDGEKVIVEGSINEVKSKLNLSPRQQLNG